MNRVDLSENIRGQDLEGILKRVVEERKWSIDIKQVYSPTGNITYEDGRATRRKVYLENEATIRQKEGGGYIKIVYGDRESNDKYNSFSAQDPQNTFLVDSNGIAEDTVFDFLTAVYKKIEEDKSK